MENFEEIEQEETLPLQPSPKKNYVLIGVITAFAVLIGGAGIFVLTQKEVPSQIPEVTSSNAITQDETTNWQTYRNEEFGFEVKYPNTWEVEILSGEAVISIMISEPLDSESMLIDSRVIQIYPLTVGQQKQTVEEIVYEFYHESKRKDLQIEKTTFQGLPSAIARFPRDTSLASMQAILKNRYLYTFPLQFTSDQILSTFRFIEPIDTSDWETYSNEEFGFEIKYPSRWTFDVPQVREEEPYLIIGFETLTPDSVSVGFQMSIYDSDPGDPDPSTQCTKTGKTITVSGKEYEKCLYLVGEGALAGWYLTIVNKGFIYDFEVDDSDIPDEVISTLQFIE